MIAAEPNVMLEFWIELVNRSPVAVHYSLRDSLMKSLLLRLVLLVSFASSISPYVHAQRQAPMVVQGIERTDPNSVTAHQQLVEKTKRGKIDVYFEGDSITRRWGATDRPALLQNWNKNFHGWNAANFAWGGDNTQNMIWRLQNGELEGVVPKVFVLQAGTNNLPWQGPADEVKVDEVVAGIKTIIGIFQRQAPDATIVLTGVFPRSQNMALRPTIESINEQLALLADGKKIRFLNINEKLADSEGRLLDGMSDDGLHLIEKGYDVWAAGLKPILQEVLGAPAEEDHAPPPTGDPSAAKVKGASPARSGS